MKNKMNEYISINVSLISVEMPRLTLACAIVIFLIAVLTEATERAMNVDTLAMSTAWRQC